MEANKDQPFILCNNGQCSKEYKYLDNAVHTKIVGPDPRDHCANERNLLTWLRTGMTLSLIGFMTIIDLTTKRFAPSTSLPWTNDAVDTNSRIVSYIFIILGMISIVTATITYFRNQQQIVKRLYHVGQGITGYFMALFIMLFVCFVMIVALFERQF